jgi:hypothetical protein
MPLNPPALDDRSFHDLVEELVARIPAHTPEWTNPRVGDPGRTMIDLFAWLADTILYRANLIPERQRLAFLRLLGIPLRPAVPARGLVTLTLEDKEKVDAVTIQAGARIDDPSPFETLADLTVLPVMAEVYYKRGLTVAEKTQYDSVLSGLRTIYAIDSQTQAEPYVTTPLFVNGTPDEHGFDLVARNLDRPHTIDGMLWVALLTLKEEPPPEFVQQVRTSLGRNPDGSSPLITLGIAPAIEVPSMSEDIGPRARIPFAWEISYVKDAARNVVDYMTLQPVPGTDTTAGLRRRGTLRLELPAAEFIGAPSNDVRQALSAGVGDRPPRIDDPKKAARLVAWLRLRPTSSLQSLPLSWVGVNAAEIEGRQTVRTSIVGQSEGQAGQEMQLPGRSVEVDTLQVQVEEPGRGYQPWERVDDIALAGRDDAAYSLDSEAGTIRFGDGVRGRIPAMGARVRVYRMRYGGGSNGNLPARTLKEISSALDLSGATVTSRTRLKVQQGLPMQGGEDAETLAAAEQRIPALFRHRDRAVTADDYRSIAGATPGVRVGRVEVIPRFKPHQRRKGVPGVMSVMVLPQQADMVTPNPRPDRPFLEAVYQYLDDRRPLGTELYAIGCEYVSIGVGVGMTLRDGFDRDGIILAVRDAVRQYLWPLKPGGPYGDGWVLGRSVSDREIEVVVARVPGVLTVSGVNLFALSGDDWALQAQTGGSARISLQDWQLPELLALAMDVDGETPRDLGRVMIGAAGGLGTGVFGTGVSEIGLPGIGIPIVPEVC